MALPAFYRGVTVIVNMSGGLTAHAVKAARTVDSSILAQPDPWMTLRRFLVLTVIALCLHGNAYWLKLRAMGLDDDLGAYSLQTVGARQSKFMRPNGQANSPLGQIAYAFQFDAGLYAKLLREYSEARGPAVLPACSCQYPTVG